MAVIVSLLSRQQFIIAAEALAETAFKFRWTKSSFLLPFPFVFHIWLVRPREHVVRSLKHAFPAISTQVKTKRSIVSFDMMVQIWFVCARLAQLVRSLTANPAEGPGFNPWPGRGFNFARRDLLSPHRPWTGTLNRLSSLSTFYRGLKRTHTLVEKIRLMLVLWSVTSSPYILLLLA